MSQRCVLTIGNFDGVHLGHRAILRRAREAAHRDRVAVVAMTFDPSPAKVLRPGSEPLRLMSTPQRLAALREAGADEVWLVEPTTDLLSESPAQFIDNLMRDRRPVALVEGPDFRFGHRREGSVATLREMGRLQGFDVHVVPQTQTSLTDLLVAPVSSSLIRWLLGLGRVADAARCLGGLYELGTVVVQGEQRGRTIGVPTANLDVHALTDRVVPTDGVYAGLVVLDDGARFPAAISIGVKPTFGRVGRTIEAHLLGFEGELYGRRIGLQFARWVRDQRPFASVNLLVEQIRRDVAEIARLHSAGLLLVPGAAGDGEASAAAARG